MIHRPPTFADYRATLALGAALGAVFLGAGGRLGMRAIAVAQKQPTAFTIDGSIAVVLLGAAAGVVAALLFLLSRTALRRHRLARNAVFWILLGAVVWRGLSPVSVLNVALFAPLFAIHGAILTAYWCRVRLAAPMMSS